VPTHTHTSFTYAEECVFYCEPSCNSQTKSLLLYLMPQNCFNMTLKIDERG